MKFPLSNKCLNVFFENPVSGEKLILTYRLYDHCLSERWVNLMQRRLASTEIADDGHFFGREFHDPDHLKRILQLCIATNNQYARDTNQHKFQIPMEVDFKAPFEVHFLNELHVWFEFLNKYEDYIKTSEIEKCLQLFNVTIHQSEEFANGEGSRTDHVQILLTPPLKEELQKKDYELFDKDYRFGELYITYGMTGVPTRDAYIHRVEPRPQNVYSTGLYLCFFEDSSFQITDKFNDWLISKNLSPDSPETAIGYIPVGKLISPMYGDQLSFVRKLGSYKKITKVEISEQPLEAKWPYDSEIYYNLDYRPYLDLKIDFDPAEMLEEAKRALPYFVTHREGDQMSSSGGEWKSLGLQSLFGDYEKTQYHTSYKFAGEPVYSLTPFAELCPKTMEFIGRITDISQCQRIRYMLLEPGAKIKVHRDSQDRDVSLAINISLNMPAGCDFYADLNADGSENEFSIKVPFSDNGSVILFNNAKYHKGENNSNVPRIHIIFHGPLKISDARLIELCRNQNRISSRKMLLKELIKKKTAVGEGFEKTPALFADWIDAGLDEDSLPESLDINVYDHAFYFDEEKAERSLQNITQASLFPLSHTVIKETQIDETLKKALAGTKSHFVLIAAGTYIHDIKKFIYSFLMFCSKMKREKMTVAGHILDWQEMGKVPFFHEQFLIINLIEWRKLNPPLPGPLFSDEEMEFCAYQSSKEHFHDHYTPYFLAPGNEVQARNGKAWWGSRMMKELLEKGHSIFNIPADIRATKVYAYPRDPNTDAWIDVHQRIGHRLAFSKQNVYVFNNEPLRIPFLEELRPNTLISVAAGFKPFKIIDQYQMNDSCRYFFLDFSAKSLKYTEEITQCRTIEEIISVAVRYTSHDNAHEIVRQHLNNLIRDFFGDSSLRLLETLKTAKNAVFNEVNFVMDDGILSSYLSINSKFVIWVSNAFYNNGLYFLLTPQAAEERYRKNAVDIARKTESKLYKIRDSRTYVFKSADGELTGLLTDGGGYWESHSAELVQVLY